MYSNAKDGAKMVPGITQVGGWTVTSGLVHCCRQQTPKGELAREIKF